MNLSNEIQKSTLIEPPQEGLYINLGNESESTGPLTLKQVKLLFYSYKICLSTLVWFQGLDNWLRIRDLEGFEIGDESSDQRGDLQHPIVDDSRGKRGSQSAEQLDTAPLKDMEPNDCFPEEIPPLEEETQVEDKAEEESEEGAEEEFEVKSAENGEVDNLAGEEPPPSKSQGKQPKEIVINENVSDEEKQSPIKSFFNQLKSKSNRWTLALLIIAVAVIAFIFLRTYIEQAVESISGWLFPLDD